jgi:hypothetical protein
MASPGKRRKFSFLITSLAGCSAGHLIRTLLRHSFDFRYALRVILTVVVTFILEPFRWFEELVWRSRISRRKIDNPPVFIIGYWRSGTTMLHNLLCSDPRAAYVTTYQTVFPNHTLSHGWWFKPIMNQFWPTHRPFDDVRMGLDLPQEEEIALANLQEISFYNFLYFPADFNRFYHDELLMENVSPVLMTRWEKAYMKLIKKSLINTGGEQFISKNPSNMVRIKHLLRMFPDARFIYIYRDPYKTVESYYQFFQLVLPAVQVQRSQFDRDREKFIGIFSDMNRRYMREKEIIPPGRLIELRFEDFRKDPETYLKQIYETFNLPGFDQALPHIRRQLSETSEFRQGTYDISPETLNWVNKHAADMVEDLGYPIRPAR